ncbi:MAG: sigma-54-dependent Fis family transcriptional regulator [Betaproteobacteria bacterium]|nr:sigma-54-dependent Fis family transcriptional regulator [Betaproteobacteria bacterium]
MSGLAPLCDKLSRVAGRGVPQRENPDPLGPQPDAGRQGLAAGRPNADPAGGLATVPTIPAQMNRPTDTLDHFDTGTWAWASVLVVDDEPGMVHFIAKTLQPLVGQLHTAGSAEEAAALVEHRRFDLVILDISLPGQSGLDWLQGLRLTGHAFEVVLITAFADVDSAIAALRAGASDFILKPFRIPQVLNSVRQCLERAQLKRENFLLRRNLEQRAPTPGALIGSSLVIRGLQEAIRRTAGVDSTVLLTGESGTGKELTALALHHGSRRSTGPFVPVNCATLSGEQAEEELFGSPGRDGLFVYAQGGTLFLDEVAELPLAQQASLLRALEERRIRPIGSRQEIPVDVRIVAATNKPLATEVAAGRFRSDLFYRLQVVEIRLAPLRSHKEDIPDAVSAHAQGRGPGVQGPRTRSRRIDRPRPASGYRLALVRGPGRGCCACAHRHRPVDAGASAHRSHTGLGGRRQDARLAAAGHLAPHAGAARSRLGGAGAAIDDPRLAAVGNLHPPQTVGAGAAAPGGGASPAGRDPVVVGGWRHR